MTASERRAERARRNRRIRRGVGAASLAAFALAWGVIAHDGAMGNQTATAATTSTDTTSSSSSTTAPSDAPVTTAQS